MIAKSVYLLAFLVSIVVVVNGSGLFAGNKAISHNVTVGYHPPGQKPFIKQYVYAPRNGTGFARVQRSFFVGNYQRINYIGAFNLDNTGHGGFATIVKGRPGENNVTIRFDSQRSYGINFLVEIYARR